MTSNLKLMAYDSIVMDLKKLFDTVSRCEQCISVLGTDKDTVEFREIMTRQIRNATSLCRSIKRNFNKVMYAQHLDIETLQQRFISLHSQLKDAVHRIKIKAKQYQPHHALREHVNHQNDIKQVYTDSKYVVNHKEILKEGWLMKKSRHLKAWRKRWVVLDKNTEDITLFTFKQQKQYTHPTERVIINHNVEIKEKHSTKNEFIVYNKSNKCKFIFKTLLQDNSKEWIQMLENERKHDININDNKKELDMNCIYIENEADEKEEMVSDDNSFENNNILYDKTNNDVQDCLLLIDDLTYLRYEEDMNSENNMIISDFEHSLKEHGVVTMEQINKLRDVAIKLIGFMLDQPESV